MTGRRRSFSMRHRSPPFASAPCACGAYCAGACAPNSRPSPAPVRGQKRMLAPFLHAGGLVGDLCLTDRADRDHSDDPERPIGTLGRVLALAAPAAWSVRLVRVARADRVAHKLLAQGHRGRTSPESVCLTFHHPGPLSICFRMHSDAAPRRQARGPRAFRARPIAAPCATISIIFGAPGLLSATHARRIRAPQRQSSTARTPKGRRSQGSIVSLSRPIGACAKRAA